MYGGIIMKNSHSKFISALIIAGMDISPLAKIRNDPIYEYGRHLYVTIKRNANFIRITGHFHRKTCRLPINNKATLRFILNEIQKIDDSTT